MDSVRNSNSNSALVEGASNGIVRDGCPVAAVSLRSRSSAIRKPTAVGLYWPSEGLKSKLYGRQLSTIKRRVNQTSGIEEEVDFEDPANKFDLQTGDHVKVAGDWGGRPSKSRKKLDLCEEEGDSRPDDTLAPLDDGVVFVVTYNDPTLLNIDDGTDEFDTDALAKKYGGPLPLLVDEPPLSAGDELIEEEAPENIELDKKLDNQKKADGKGKLKDTKSRKRFRNESGTSLSRRLRLDVSDDDDSRSEFVSKYHYSAESCSTKNLTPADWQDIDEYVDQRQKSMKEWFENESKLLRTSLTEMQKTFTAAVKLLTEVGEDNRSVKATVEDISRVCNHRANNQAERRAHKSHSSSTECASSAPLPRFVVDTNNPENILLGGVAGVKMNKAKYAKFVKDNLKHGQLELIRSTYKFLLGEVVSKEILSISSYNSKPGGRGPHDQQRFRSLLKDSPEILSAIDKQLVYQFNCKVETPELELEFPAWASSKCSDMRRNQKRNEKSAAGHTSQDTD